VTGKGGLPGALPPIVDAAWLARHHAEVVVADVRWRLVGPSGRQEFADGHIPGSVFVDLDTHLASITVPEEGRHPMPSPDEFAAAMGALGIGDNDAVVAVDDAGGLFAARLTWMLRVIGHPATLLDGGVDAWPTPLESGPGTPRPPAVFTAVPWPPGALATIDEAADTDRLVVDARGRERYRGQAEPVDPRAGHIPGAINLPCDENLAPDGTLRPAEELRAAYAQAGVTDASDVIAYCGSGVTACHDLLVMEHLGLGRGRLFAGSWSAYSHHPQRPAATGDTPD
jgi:thiosulfate/3-mercaptopyruvate sulfurtransferase